MFAKSWKELVIRTLSSAVIVFNTVAPTTAVVQAKQEVTTTTGHAARSVKQESRSIPTFERPEPRLGGRLSETSPVDLDRGQSLRFVQNVGQFDSRIKFIVNGSNGAALLTEDAIWLSIQDLVQTDDKTSPDNISNLEDQNAKKEIKQTDLKITFPGSNIHARVEPFNKSDTNISFFYGDDPSQWQTNVPVWNGVRYVDFYPGANLEISNESGSLAWELVITDSKRFLENGAQSTKLYVDIAGHEKLTLDANSLQVNTKLNGKVVLPVLGIRANDSANTKVEKEVRQVGDNQISISIAVRDEDKSLPGSQETSTQRDIIPRPGPSPFGLGYSTFLFTCCDYGEINIAVDSHGATYIAGQIFSTDPPLPTTPGSFQGSFNGGNSDVFVAKLNPTGSALEYVTYLGGSTADRRDDANAIAVDETGSAYIGGETSSTDFPKTEIFGDGGIGGYIAKLSPTGSSLIYSASIGGEIDDIALDENHNVYLVGQAGWNFPVTPGAFDTSYNGGMDVGVAKLDATGSVLIYAAYLGGSNWDLYPSIAVNGLGEVYIAGYTESSNFPTTDGAFDRSLGGSADVFVTKVNSTGSAKIFSTLLGGTQPENINPRIAIDPSGNVYIAGNTSSADFPTTPGAFDTSSTGGAFVTVLNASGSGLVFSTYLGNGWVQAIDRDSLGNIYVLGFGTGNRTDFPVTSNAYDRTGNIFLAMFTSEGFLEYSTLFGGAYDLGTDMVVSNSGSIYFTGKGGGSDFPVTPGAFNRTSSGSFVVKLVRLTPLPNRMTFDSSFGLDSDISRAEECSQGYEGGPINTRTGGYDYATTDLSIRTAAGPLTFERTYSSLATGLYSDKLGYGWTHNHDLYLLIGDYTDGKRSITLKGHTANQYVFTQQSGSSATTAEPGVFATLVQGTSSFILTDHSQNHYEFDLTSGKLISYTNSNGLALLYTYDTSGRLEKISDQSGQHFLSLAYSGSSTRIISVSDHTGRSVTYHYDVNGDLDYVIDVLGQTWTYEYHQTLGHFITRVAAPGNITVERTEYYPDGRAWKQFDGEGRLVVELTYNADGTTTVKDALNNVKTHTYDDRGTLVSDENAFGSQQRRYNVNFCPDLITDPLGNETTLLWSANGGELGYIKNALNQETIIYYDDPDNPSNLTQITDALDYETKYFYTDMNFPTLPTRIEYPLSFDGGVTYIATEYEYYPPSSGASAGKVKFVTDAQGHQTYYTYTSTGQTESVTTAYGTANALTTTYEYDNLGRVINVTNEQGRVTHNEYDAAGRLLKTTQNYVSSRPQNDENKYNLVTEYRYDARGDQIAVIDTYGVITRTYYDLANRLVSVVQNLTGQTIETASPPARGSIPDENIRTDTIYDNAGHVIAIIDPAGVITRAYYDEANRPVTVVKNLMGQDVTIVTPPAYNPATPDQNVRMDIMYDANGNLIANIDTLGVITRTYYDALNRPTTTVQNLTGQEISVGTPPGRGTSSNIRTDAYYDANGNVIATTDPKGITTRTYYDALNRPITVVQNLLGQSISEPIPPAAGVESNIRSDTYYDQAGNAIATVDPRGVVTRTYYDEANRPVTIVQNLVGQDIYFGTPPAHGTDQNIRTDNTYDQDGRRATATDPLGRVTKYEYNDVGQLLNVTANYVNGGVPQNDQDQRNIVTEYAYDALGRQIKTTDTLGRVTLNAYDDLGRVTSVTQNYLQGQAQNYKDASGNQYNLIATYSYGVHGNQIAVTDTAGVITRTYYDALARPVTVVRNLDGQAISIATPPARTNPPSAVTNLRTDTIYLGTGSVDSVVDEMGKVTDYTYDPLGQLITVLDPLQKSTSFEYDANGNRTLTTDANEIATRYEYDALNRLKLVWENYRAGVTPDHKTNVRTEYTYDANGNRLSILDGNDHSTSFMYTALGQLETETDALGYTTSYGYDAIGNRVSLLDANGKTTTYGYDELNRLVLIDYSDPDADVTFDYDPLGRRQSMNDGVGTTAWDYNNLGLPNSITDPFGAKVSYGYDRVGNRTRLTYPDHRVVNYQYDAANRLTAVSGQQLTVSYQYDAAGRVETIERLNGVDTHYSYLDNGWLQEITHSRETDPLSSFTYSYDAVGNRTQAVEVVHSSSVEPKVTVLAASSTGTPLAGKTVYAFNGNTYTGYSKVTDANGEAALTLPGGDYYRFRVDVDGTQFWSGPEDDSYCYVPTCMNVVMSIPEPVLVTVQDTDGTPAANLDVYAFNGSTYTGIHGKTNENGQVSLRLPEGSYRFRADLNGTQFWSGESNHCTVAECTMASVSVTLPVTVSVVDTDGAPKAGLKVYAFNGSTYTGYNGTTNESGQVTFTLPQGSYRFRADLNGTQFWSGASNHCDLPGCGSAQVTVTNGVLVTVLDTDGAPKAGLNVYAFNGSTYTGYNKTTNAGGQAIFTLPLGSYRFRADLNGTQFWSAAENHCNLPGCGSASITVTNGVLVTVLDTDGAPKASLNVYAFNGSTYTGYSKTTNANGQAVFTLPQGSYRFRADLNGTQFWSGASNHCDLPGCGSASVTVSKPMTVTVLDTDGAPKAGLNVYAFNGSTYTGYSKTTNADGQAVFTLPLGSYRFRADLNGTQFWSGASNHCDLPGCGSAQVTVTIPLTVTIQDGGGAPKAGVNVYAFHGSTYTGYSKVSDASGQAVFTLPAGSYRFRADHSGTQYWSDSTDHCTLPGCLTASVTVGPAMTPTATLTSTETPLPSETPTVTGYEAQFVFVSYHEKTQNLKVSDAPLVQSTNEVTVTVLDTTGAPKEGLHIYAFDGSTYTGYNGTTNANGNVTLTLPDGNYRFRADLNGTQFWSGTENHCTVPGCSTVSITVTLPVTVTVLDTTGAPKEGLHIYAFDGSTYTGYTGITNANGNVTLTLPQGSYRFRADLNGTQLWSEETNHCTLPGCTNASVTVTLPVIVTVRDTDSTPKEGLNVYAFDGATYTGFHGVTNASGQAVFTLPQGNYRFRADLNGTQFWSGESNHCTLPGCTSASVTVTKPIWMEVLDWDSEPKAGLDVYAFDGSRYTGFHGVSDANGRVTFTLPQGSYRFRADYEGVSFWSGEENHCSTSGCVVIIPGWRDTITTQTINYTYDPLYRLTAADYSTGDFYHYTYDTVSNRLTSSDRYSVTSYQYDAANRLTQAGSMPYTWDANGNLLQANGVTYTYDTANRLAAVTKWGRTTSYAYNGQGDWLQRTDPSGNTSRFTLDLNAGLTQVLDDGEYAYTYGLERLTQRHGDTHEYFLEDGLGSVRQLVDRAGVVTLGQGYDPYGVGKQFSGGSWSAYGFAGEYTDDFSDLVYLRARYYNPAMGRFLTKDTWEGDAESPMSFNHWMYVNGNPVNFADPSGKYATTNDGNGYAEGWMISVTSAFQIVKIRGEEIVYDFETMERARFSYTGEMILEEGESAPRNPSSSLFSAGGSVYVSFIFGFDEDGIVKDYSGRFRVGQLGVGSRKLPLSAGAAVFSSVFPGTTAPNFDVFGVSFYGAASLTAKIPEPSKVIEWLNPIEVAGFVTNATSTSKEFYSDNRDKMIQDIRSGNGSPIPFGGSHKFDMPCVEDALAGLPPIPLSYPARELAVAQAQWYWENRR